MQKVIMFMLLFTLSFSVAHDSLISFFEHEEHKNISPLNIESSQDKASKTFKEIHNIFHFMAILTFFTALSPDFFKNTVLKKYTFFRPYPLKELAYKPPIV